MKYARLFWHGAAAWARAGDSEWVMLSGAPYAGGRETGARVPVNEARLLPAVDPTKIVGVGRNYRAHAAELGHAVPEEPLLFLKPPSALAAALDPIRIPPGVGRVDHEAELGVVIGRRAAHITSRDDARAHIFGYCCVNDVTARELQKRDVQFTRAKGFDSFCPVGPHLVTDVDPGDLRVTCRVDGEVRQDGRTSAMIFSVAELVLRVSQVMSLLPGDIICTGTPSGVGPIAPGATVEVEVEHVGVLRNPVAAAEE